MKERAHSEDTGIDGKIILKYFLNKWDERNWTILAWLKIETSSCEHINELAELMLASQGDYFV
jgi:hypothetical protein